MTCTTDMNRIVTIYKAIKVLSLIILFTPSLSLAAQLDHKTTIRAEVVHVRDGDTVEITAYPWPGFTPTTAIRLADIDTPELRAKCPEEKIAALAAKDFLTEILTDEVTITNLRYGKYAGRHIGEIITSKGVNVSESMIKNGHARAYSGGKRKGWCE